MKKHIMYELISKLVGYRFDHKFAITPNIKNVKDYAGNDIELHLNKMQGDHRAINDVELNLLQQIKKEMYRAAVNLRVSIVYDPILQKQVVIFQ